MAVEEADGQLLAVRRRGKLAKNDYEHFVPEVERIVK